MQLATTPIRMASQWMMLPIMLALVGVAGIGAGLFHAWAEVRLPLSDSWPIVVGSSMAIWILLPAVSGMITNSWSMAGLVGAFSMFAARVISPVVEQVVFENYQWFGWSDILLRIPMALVVGAALGWAGSAWRYDEGIARSLGASFIAGSLAWTAWDVLANDWSREGHVNQVAWGTVALAVLIVLLCRSVGSIVMAAVGSAAVAVALNLGPSYESLQMDSLIRESVDYVMDLYRRFA